MSGNFGMGSPFPTQPMGINRSGPRNPPPIPGIDNPFSPTPGSYMEQALMLSGVPGLLSQPQKQAPSAPKPPQQDFRGLLGQQSPPPDWSQILQQLNPQVLANLGLGSNLDLGLSNRFAWM